MPREEKPLRIAIASLGRFHVLDLARELANIGHDVRFYSYVPRRRAQRFGLPPECHVGLLPFLFPLVSLQRMLPRRLSNSIDRCMYYAANLAVISRLRPCDVFVCMSGIYLEAAVYARNKYNAQIYLERGSRHILSQRDILAAIPGAETPPAFAIRRELKGYEIADRIVVPSVHAELSFMDQGVLKEKLFRNPYGVDLEMFQPTEAPSGLPPTLLYVGAWSLQKGADLLVEAVRHTKVARLIHVGEIADASFPHDACFVHYPPVPQWRLRDYYGKAHIFVIASRQDGFGLVIAQALACGLPVVCTNRTGGEDLRSCVRDPGFIAVAPSDDAKALARSIEAMLPRALSLCGSRDLLLRGGRDHLSWRGYATRYADELASSLDADPAASVTP